ncbi:hypothetical protein YC2023_083649 [Brassica napus]
MGSFDLSHASSFKGGSETFLRNVFENILKTYLRKNPTAKTIWELVQSVDNEKICYDHFTFQTFKNPYRASSWIMDRGGSSKHYNMGHTIINNKILKPRAWCLPRSAPDYGYKAEGGLDFPTKKLRVLTFSPPDIYVPDDGHGLGNGPLPRLVIAELLVDELSSESKEIIRKYLKPKGGKQAEKPISTDFQQLAKYITFSLIIFPRYYVRSGLRKKKKIKIKHKTKKKSQEEIRKEKSERNTNPKIQTSSLFFWVKKVQTSSILSNISSMLKDSHYFIFVIFDYLTRRGLTSGNKFRMSLGLPVAATVNCVDNTGAKNL